MGCRAEASLAEPHPRARVWLQACWNALRHARLHNRIAFRGVNCHYDRSVFPFPTQQLIEHNRQASETETFPLASRKHGKHIASLHKLSTTSSCSGLSLVLLLHSWLLLVLPCTCSPRLCFALCSTCRFRRGGVATT